jgi:hypothetical protein
MDVQAELCEDPGGRSRDHAPISSTDIFRYDATKDSKCFLVNRYVKPDNITPLTVVLNAETESAAKTKTGPFGLGT